jgi:hypothetical protein
MSKEKPKWKAWRALMSFLAFLHFHFHFHFESNSIHANINCAAGPTPSAFSPTGR